MKFIGRLAAAAGLAIAVGVAVVGPASASTASTGSGAAGAVFVQTDNLAGNSVVAYRRAADGSLAQARTYSTGGLGGQLTGAVVDFLASQGSLVLSPTGRRLYAVNAGSDTITVFGVRGDRLDRRQVLPSGGSFPASVATHGRLVYVLNARDGGSLQGFLDVGDRLVKVPFWHRELGLDTAVAPEFTHTPGQVAFTPDGSKLIVTTKASNTIEVFDVDRAGALSRRPVVTQDPGAVPFAIAFDRSGHLLIAEAGTNAVASFAVHRSGTLALVQRVVTGQAATCWIAGDGRYFYASNAGSGSVTGVRAHRNGTLSALGNTATDKGTVDAATAADGRYLYVQTGAAGIVDAFRVHRDGSLTAIGSVTVAGSAGGEGIAAS